MRKSILIFLVVIVAIFTFNEKEIYKKDIRNRLVIQGIGIDIEKDYSYTVTLQTIDTNAQSATSEDGASQPPIKTYKMTGVRFNKSILLTRVAIIKTSAGTTNTAESTALRPKASNPR